MTRPRDACAAASSRGELLCYFYEYLEGFNMITYVIVFWYALQSTVSQACSLEFQSELSPCWWQIAMLTVCVRPVLTKRQRELLTSNVRFAFMNFPRLRLEKRCNKHVREQSCKRQKFLRVMTIKCNWWRHERKVGVDPVWEEEEPKGSHIHSVML